MVIIKYDDVIKNDLIKPDNIYQQLHAFLPEGFYTDPEAFIKDFVDMHSEGVFGVPKYTFTNVNRKHNDVIVFTLNEHLFFCRFWIS